jgi:hypothetical protein
VLDGPAQRVQFRGNPRERSDHDLERLVPAPRARVRTTGRTPRRGTGSAAPGGGPVDVIGVRQQDMQRREPLLAESVDEGREREPSEPFGDGREY